MGLSISITEVRDGRKVADFGIWSKHYGLFDFIRGLVNERPTGKKIGPGDAIATYLTRAEIARWRKALNGREYETSGRWGEDFTGDDMAAIRDAAKIMREGGKVFFWAA